MSQKKLSLIYIMGVIFGITALVILGVSFKTQIWSFLTGEFSLVLILSCIFLILLLLSAYMFQIHHFGSAITQIIEEVHRAQNDDLTIRCEYNKKNLIGALAAAINGLIDAIERRSNESAELHSELASIIKNIPGGMFRCMSDENLTLIFVNKGFLAMLGYTEEELQIIYQNRYINLVHKEDREALWETLEAQSLTEETINAVYRVYHSDGGYRWVHQQGSFMIDDNGTWHDNVVIDITEQKKAQDAHLASESRYRLVMQATSDWICEFDLTNNYLISDILPDSVGKTYDEAFNYALKKYVYPEDIELVSKKYNREALLQAFKSGRSEVAFEFRTNETGGRYVWSSVTIIPIIDASNHSIYCMAYFRNVNERKNAEIALMEKAQTDSLTHLYNNETTKMLIGNYLLRDGKDGKHALLIMDIDDFKHVNDTWGHLFGDAVLRGISQKMKQLFRSTDVLGRIGGDEFVIFLKNAGSIDFIKEKSAELLKVFSDSFRDEARGYNISGSIGIAVYPQHGATYTELMAHADKALYDAKDGGKNGFVVYNDDADKGEKSSTGTANKPDCSKCQKHGFNIDNTECILMAYIFKMLFESDDVNASIKSALQMIGEHYKASQVYVYFNMDDENEHDFEWCDTETPLTKQQIFDFMDNDSPCACYPLLNQEEIFYCNDISKLPEALAGTLAEQNVNFIMQFFIQQDGVLQGISGIASSRDDICLTQSEIETLDILSRVIHLILVKRTGKS